jgi:NAD+ kinase
MDAMILNPVCPFTLSNRPIVVPGAETIEILVGESKRTGIILTVDGQEVVGLEAGDRVSFVHASRRALIYTPERQSFYEVLRNKLSWSGGADD